MKQLPIEQSFPIFQTGISSNDENISQVFAKIAEIQSRKTAFK